jgi:sugar phosphate permease
MVAIRFIFGAAEGGFPPASSVTIAEVFPKEQRGRAKSFLVSASVIGGGFGALVTSIILVAYSWRMAFFIFGILGLVLTVLFYIFIRVHKGSAEEADQAAAATATKFSLKNVAKVPMVLQLGLIYFGAGVVNWGLTSWLPSYWVNVQGLSMKQMGAAMVLPAAAMFLFMQVSGFILDKYAAGREKWVLLAGALGVALFIYLMMGAKTTVEALIYSTLAFTAMAFITSTVFVLPLKYLPMGMIGSATGFINFMQQVAGIIAPTVMGFLLTRFAGSYVPVFYFVIGSVLFSAVITLLIKTKAGVQNA